MRDKKKDKPSTLQLIRQSPFYRNVSGRLSLNDRSIKNHRTQDSAKQNSTTVLNGGASLLPKLSFRKSHSTAVTPSSPDADDGGFATWRGSCEGLSQLQEIIRRRTDALTEEDEIRNVPKSQSAYALRNVPAVTSAPMRSHRGDLGSNYDLASTDVSRRGSRISLNTIDTLEQQPIQSRRPPACRPTTLETSRNSSPARPSSLPTAVSIENNFSSKRPASTPNCDIWIPPENIVLRKPLAERPSTDRGLYYSEASRPPSSYHHGSLPRSSTLPGTSTNALEYNNIISTFPFYTPPAPLPTSAPGTRAVRPSGLVPSATMPSGLGSSSWSTASHQPQIVSTPVVHSSSQLSWNPPPTQTHKRPHSIATSTPEYETYLRPNTSLYQGIPPAGWPSSSTQGSLRRHPPVPVPTTTSAALSPSDSGYRSLPSSSSDYQLFKNPSVSAQQSLTSSLPLPNRRMSLPTSSQNHIRASTPRPSPTFHGQPFRPVSVNGSSYLLGCTHASSNAARQALQMLFSQPRNGFILGDDKVALLLDILDTQERFAKVMPCSTSLYSHLVYYCPMFYVNHGD